MIYGGFIYNEKHSFNDMGLVIRTVNRPLIAPQKTMEQERVFDDGKGDYTSVNPKNRAMFDNKAMTLECAFLSRLGYAELQKKAAQISAWLSNVRGGYSPLIFDDMPLIQWNVKPANNIPFSHQLAAIGEFSLTFECEPFNSYIFDSSNLTLDADIPLDSEFMIGNVITVNEGPAFYNTSAPSRPVVIIRGSGTNSSVGCNGNTISYTGSWSGEMVIDCIEAETRVNMNIVRVTGSYFELMAGDNELVISGITGASTVEAVYPYNVYYGED